MDVLIAKDRAALNMRAKGLHDASMAAVAAGDDAKDADEAVRDRRKIEGACENCHSAYWYPTRRYRRSLRRRRADRPVGLRPSPSAYLPTPARLSMC